MSRIFKAVFTVNNKNIYTVKNRDITTRRYILTCIIPSILMLALAFVNIFAEEPAINTIILSLTTVIVFLRSICGYIKNKLLYIGSPHYSYDTVSKKMILYPQYILTDETKSYFNNWIIGKNIPYYILYIFLSDRFYKDGCYLETETVVNNEENNRNINEEKKEDDLV